MSLFTLEIADMPSAMPDRESRVHLNYDCVAYLREVRWGATPGRSARDEWYVVTSGSDGNCCIQVTQSAFERIKQAMQSR